MKKSILEKKGFAVFMMLFGILGLLLMAHHIFSYEAILRPRMDYLLENKIITNGISGPAFLRMFTNESNVFVDIYLILFALGIFGIKPLYKFTHNEWLRGAITVYIGVTGIIYFTVLLPFSQPFPMEEGIWFSNVINIWNHLITPVFFVALWFSPVIMKKIPTVKYGFLHLIYPACYFVWSVILGAVDGFYPYPFLSGRQMWNMLFKAKEYNSAAGVLILCVAFILLALIFFGVSCALSGIHNKRVKKLDKKEKETVTK